MTLPVKIDIKKPTLKDLQNTVPIDQVLVIVFKLVGLPEKNWPSTNPQYNEKQFLIDYIRKTYGTIRAEEIKIAFEMALKGRIKVDTQHYMNFSPEYFSRIMNAYLEWKVPFSRQTTKKIENPKGWSLQDFQKFIVLPYRDYVKTGLYPFKNDLEWLFYHQLNIIGVSMKNHEITNTYYEKAKLLTGRDTEKQKERLRRDCATDLFKAWFKECREFEVDIDQLIKEKL